MKHSTTLASALVFTAATMGVSSTAQAELSANIGVTSDYVWRGISQSGGSASVSGGVDYAAESGFYVGTWVGALGEGNGSEVDVYFGFGGEVENFSYDLGYIYYAYPSIDPGINFGEVYGSVGVAGFTLGLNYTVNNDSANDGGPFESGDMYYYLSYGVDLQDDWSIGATIGSYAFDNDGAGLDLDYVHYGIDLGKSTELGDFTLTLSDTDLDGNGGDSDPRLVVSWGLGF